MPLYMIQFGYTAEAWAALTRNPQNRAEGLSAMAQSMGAKLVDVYYCFGDYDGLVLLDAPDDVTATAVVLSATVPGHLKTTRTTRLLTVDEGMEAMRKAGAATYAAPPGMTPRS